MAKHTKKVAIERFKAPHSLAVETNLLLSMTDNEIDDLTDQVYNGLRRDYKSCKEWQQNAARWVRLALQVMERKDTPWPNASNVKYPLITMAAMQFVATAYPLMVQTPHMVRAYYGGSAVQEVIDAGNKICDHLSWQLLEGMPDWERDTDRLLLVLAIVGTCFRKTFWDPITNAADSTLVLPNALICDYGASSVESAARVSHMFNLYRHEIEDKIRAGVYGNIDPGMPSLVIRETDRPYEQKENDNNRGIMSSGELDETTSPYNMVEQCLRYDADGDGYAEPLRVTMVLDTKTILRVEKDYQDSDVTYGTTTDNKQVLVRIKRATMYTGYHFMPNYHSAVYSLGFGQIVGPVNAATNTLFNQLVDSGTAALSRGGLLARGVSLPVGVTLTGPGTYHKTDMPADQLGNSVFQLPVAEPSDVLFKLLGLLVDVGRQLSSTMDPQIGENPGQNQPAMTTFAVLEQGAKVFKSIYKRIHRGFKAELAVLMSLNKAYLPATVYTNMTGEELPISQDDYANPKLRVVPYTDPNMVSATELLARQRAIGELLPVGHVNRKEFTRRTLEAMREPQIETLMAPEPAVEDPKITIAKMKAQLEHLRILLDSDHQYRQTHHEAIKDLGVAILAVAKAESEEKNRDVSDFTSRLDALGRIVDIGAQAHLAQAQPSENPSEDQTEPQAGEPDGEVS